ncbi:hypothetical protein BCT63_18465 [Vibrio kanaloae]|uniref:hypothetical protein n=1 Tax=Vibrio TaxID=662 RepID=UPI000C8373B3|nr:MULTISPECIES: hypothetical protein [Vibrio]PMI28646.1 hypothetical protein BCU48_14895 [Vibrio splendidus]PMM01888.1 hypothetical protein BCT63_18465 [Vibrio kanaloae]
MTKKSKRSVSPGLSVGGVSSLAIVIVNSFELTQYSEAIIMGIPIGIGVLFFIFEYWFTFLNIPSLDELKVTSKLDRQVKYLEKRIKKAVKGKRSPESIANLEKELNEAELARAKASVLFSEAKTG